MNHKNDDIIFNASSRWSFIFLGMLVMLFVGPSVMAQNTKGDKPTKQNPIIRFPKLKRHAKGGDRANTRDISGRRKIRQKNRSSVSHIIYSNSNPESKRRTTASKGGDHASVPRFRVRVRSVSAQRARNNVFPQSGPYVNNSAKRPTSKVKHYTRAASGGPIIRNNPNNTQRPWLGNLKGGSIGAGSASRSWVTRGRKNVYWGKFSKGEKGITKDLTGRDVRTRNFHSLSPGVGRSDTGKTVARRPSAEGANFGKIRGGYSSISGDGRAWRNDISGHRLRMRLAQRGKGHGIFSGFRSASGRGRNNNPLPVRRPGIGAGGISKMLRKSGGKNPRGGGPGEEVDKFSGDITKEDLLPSFGNGGLGYSGGIKTKRRERGGGSVSGKVFNNRGRALQVRPPGGSMGMGTFQGNLLREDVTSKGFNRDGSGFSGNIKSARPQKGGGSVSGKLFNNNGRSLQARPPGEGSWAIGSFRGHISKDELEPQLNRRLSGYSGDIRGRRPLKGGGSVSGKVFNNSGRSLQVRPPGEGSWAIGSFRGHISKDEIEPQLDRGLSRYSGNLKGGRPLKGGGSVSGKFFNNGGRALQVRPPGRGSWAIGNFRGAISKDELEPQLDRNLSRYSGTLKGYRPLKGGGSVSGKYLSNGGKPIQVRPPGRESWGIPGFQGRIKTHKPEKGGGSVSGIVWNNNQKPITVQYPHNGDPNNYSGKIALSRFKKYYVKNPHSVDDALKKRKPDATTFTIGGLTGKRTSPTYVRNPSSNSKALKTWSPGVAYARLKDYQGNQRMTKLTNPRLHPDSKFAHGNKDNVKSERSITTNIKLLWAKFFKKNGGQPDIVKEKKLIPRYDKKEKDLWKALYD